MMFGFCGTFSIDADEQMANKNGIHTAIATMMIDLFSHT